MRQDHAFKEAWDKLYTRQGQVKKNRLTAEKVNHVYPLHPISEVRQTREVEAESCAYVLMKALLGLDSKEYSFSYIAGWSSGKEIPELMASLKTIHDTSAEIINMFNEQMKEGEGCE